MAKYLDLCLKVRHIAFMEKQSTKEKQLLTSDYRLWLQKELTRRCRMNTAYSIRSFAKSLGMDSSSLSQVLAGKRNLSKKVIAKLCDQVGVSPEQKEILVSGDLYTPTHQITMDAFSVISNWYHYAILELTSVEGGCENNPKWISQCLGINAAEVRLAIERLKRLELLEDQEGTLLKTHVMLTNYEEGMTNGALKELQRQIIQKSLEAIDEVQGDRKDITSMTMAIDESKMPEAKLKIQKFRRELCKFLENGKQSTVFNLGIQLYPVSKKIKGKER